MTDTTSRAASDLHVYDTTLRDGAQQEGLNLSVVDKLAIARHLDELGVGFIEGGWPGANPKDTEFFQRAQHELRPPERDAGGVRRHPPGRVEGRRRPAGPRAAGLRRAGRHPRREVARPARRGGAADDPRGEPRDDPRHRGLPARRGAPGVPRRRALLRRVRGRPRLRARGGPGRGRGRRRGGRPLRHQRRDAAAAGRRTSSPTSSRRPAPGSASTATTTPAAPSPTRWRRSRPARATSRAP